MVDRFICYIVLVVTPTTLLATVWQWLSIEVGLAIIWTMTLSTIVVGVVEYMKDRGAYDRPGR